MTVNVVVSVVVPVYNTGKYLQKSVESLLAQSMTDFELILVDDGSTDDSGALCDSLAETDQRIHVIHKQNGGLSSARLAGFRAAKGKYICFVDSDDTVYPTYLEKLYSAIEKTQAELAISAYTVVGSSGEKDIFLPYHTDSICEKDITDCYVLPLVGRTAKSGVINLPGFMWIRLYRTDLIRESYFISERKVFTEDDIFNLFYADNIKTIAVVNEPLYFYFQHPESLSNRYRPGKWTMLLNRWGYIERYLSERGLSEAAGERLNAAMLSAVMAGMDNAVLSGTYRAYKAELNVMYAAEQSRSVSSSMGTSMQKAALFLFRHKLYSPLYYLRRWRMKRA